MKYKLAYILLFLTCGGCMFSSNYPAPTKYMLDVKPPKKIATIRTPGKNLMVSSTVIIPQFANATFVYRISNIQYMTDYYNEFYTLPATLINEAMVAYLNATKTFSFVTNANHPLRTPYLLTSKVTALYADYRDRNQPKAVMTIQFNLFKQNAAGNNFMLLNKTFSAATLLQHKDSASLVNGWNQDLQIILSDLAQSLRKIR